jgi:hypothetical protein
MKFIFLGSLLISSLIVLAQEEKVIGPEDLPHRVQVIQSEVSDPQIPKSIHEDDDVSQIELQRAKQGQAFRQIDEINQEIQQKIINGPEELQKLGYKTLDAAALMDTRVVALVQRMFTQGPLKGASRSEVAKLMLSALKDRPGEEWLRNHPRVLYALADVLRDEKAMPQLVGILSRQEDLKRYFFIWFGFMIFSWLIKRHFFKKKVSWSFSKRLFVSVAFNLCVSGTTFFIFYQIFEAELSPTAQILVHHWRRRNLPLDL